MTNETYLVGTYRDRKEIERLMSVRPTFINHEYTNLCRDFLEYLYLEDPINLREFDWALDEFLKDMEEDVRETLLGLNSDIHPYLANVKEAMQFFKSYLDTLDWVPIPENVHVSRSNTNSVMVLKIITPRNTFKRN